MEKFLVLICLAVVAGLQVVTSQSPAPGSCIHFSYPQQAANCLPFANCSGAQCNMTYPNGHASFIVHKCQDPVTVDLSIMTGNSVFRRRFNHSESVSNKFITMSRNATHLHFEVTARIQGDIMTILIPTVTVPLNPRACMCQSLQSVAQALHLPQIIPIQFSCTHNTTTCNKVHCQFSNYPLDMTFDPCSEAIQLTVHDSNGGLIYQKTFNDSQNVTFTLPSSISSFLGSTATLNVIIVHHNYSMEIEGSILVNIPLVGRRTVQVLPHHTIILDKSNCSNATSLPPPTSSPHTPSPHTASPHTASPASSSPPTSTSSTSQTCQALRNLASSNPLCNTTRSCTTVECQMLQYHTAMTVLPCHTPPAIRIVVHNATGWLLYNETLARSRTFRQDLFTLNVTVEHVSSEAIAVEVDLVAPVPLPLLPRTTIPIDRSHCPGYTPSPSPSTLPPKHSHTHPPSHPPTTHTHTITLLPHPSTTHTHTITLLPHPSTTHTPTHTSKTPLPTTPPNNNCPALSHMTETLRRINRFTCEFSATCDKADCSQGEGHIVLVLLPCHSPPGFRMIFYRGDYVPLNHTFTHSEENYFIPVLNATMNVTVNHISDNEIEVEVIVWNVHSATTMIPRTVVRLDRSSCPSVGSQVVVAVVIPLVVVLCLVVVIVLVVVAVVLVGRRKRNHHQYQFHRVKFSEVTED